MNNPYFIGLPAPECQLHEGSSVLLSLAPSHTPNMHESAWHTVGTHLIFVD